MPRRVAGRSATGPNAAVRIGTMAPAAERGNIRERADPAAAIDKSIVEPLTGSIYNMSICEEGTLMGSKSHISKWGTSLAIRIPKPIAEQWGVREGSAIEIVSRGNQVVLRKKSYSLDDMLANVTPGNLHSELDTSPALGNEEW